MTTIKSLSKSFMNMPNNFNKYSNLEIFVIIFSVILAVGYISNREFYAVIFFLALSYIINKFTKKQLALSLFISIIITNLLISLNFFSNIEGMENNEKKADELLKKRGSSLKKLHDELHEDNKNDDTNKGELNKDDIDEPKSKEEDKE
jgi:ABC-type transport system involved in cytochrome bd biosynthesis fused ATPase/permease subunit